MIGASAERQLLTCRLDTPVRRGPRGGAGEDTPVRTEDREEASGRESHEEEGENAEELHMATTNRNRCSATTNKRWPSKSKDVHTYRRKSNALVAEVEKTFD